MMGGQVGEAVRRHLIRHREHIPQVLDGQVPGLLGLGQEARGGSFRDQHGRGVVVRFHPLAQEVREITRRGVPEHEMAEGLQQDRAGRVHAHGFLLQVDPPVAQVGDGPDRPREILRVPDRETLVADDGQQRPLRQRAAPVADGLQRLRRRALDLGEVVAPFPHRVTQPRVGHPRLLRGGRRPGALPAQLGVEPDQVLEHVIGHPGPDLQVRQPQLGVQRIMLCLLHRDLQLGPAARRLGPQQFLGRHGQGPGQRVDQGQLGLTAAVLQQGQRRGRPAHPAAELGQRVPARPAQVTEPLPECRQV